MKKHLSLALLISVALQAFQPGSFRIESLDQPIFSDQLAWTSVVQDIVPNHIPARMKVTVTGYSSTPDQTDDTPFITASGKWVRDGIIASNFLAFGTRVQIPKLFGDKIFTVEDRMNRRYYERVDIWFPDRESALKFGKRDNVEIVIL